jgi:drug/metabolite transporter (DMT)-like permease
MSDKMTGTLSIALATVIWGSAFVAQSVGMEHIGPFTFLAVRGALAVATLLSMIALQNRGKFMNILTDKRLWQAGIPCGIALFIATGLQQVGLLYTTAGKGGFITAMYIILVPVFGLFVHRKPPKTALLSVVIATMGLYFISGAGMTSINLGDILMLLCAAAFAVQILLIDRFSPELDSMALNMAQCLVCSLLCGIFTLLFEQPEAANIVDCWLPLAYAGVLSMGIAYTLQIVGQKKLEPTTASLLMSFESVFAVLSGWIILGETLSMTEFLGCALVLAGIFLTQIPSKNATR